MITCMLKLADHDQVSAEVRTVQRQQDTRISDAVTSGAVLCQCTHHHALYKTERKQKYAAGLGPPSEIC